MVVLSQGIHSPALRPGSSMSTAVPLRLYQLYGPSLCFLKWSARTICTACNSRITS